MASFNDYSLASFITGSFTLISLLLAYYLRNRRSMKKVTAEEFIESFMKRQQEEIGRKDDLLTDRDKTIRHLELAVKKLTQKNYKYSVLVKELRALIKELKEENRQEKLQNDTMMKDLQNLKDNYETIYAKKFVKAVKDGEYSP